MRTRLFVVASMLAFTPVMASCVVHTEDRSQEWIRRHASTDMRCPMGQLTVHHNTATPHRKRVEGCGQDVVYVEVCQGTQCSWVRESTPPPASPSVVPPR